MRARQPHAYKLDMYVTFFLFNFLLAMSVEAPNLVGYVNINC